MSNQREELEGRLQECAREPIHVPGTIQPHGSLVAARADDGDIVYASENCRDLLDRSAAHLLGKSAARTLGEGLWQQLKSAADENSKAVPDVQVAGSDRRLFASVHRHEGLIVAEFEPLRPRADGLLGTFFEKQQQLLDSTSLDDVFQTGVQAFGEITGYEHVMMYKFHDNWDGEVIAEVGSDRLPSYQNHRFPGSDIPAQARELYRLNPFRMIADVDYEPVSIASRLEKPLDLSFAWLRSVSPVHRQYLRNMGVGASLSVSVIVEGRLWGLVACHHPEERLLGHEHRRIAEFLGRQLSAQVGLHLERRRQDYLDRYQDVLRLPHRFLGEEISLIEHLKDQGEQLVDLMDAGGLIIRLFGETETIGHVPPSEACRRLMDWLDGTDRDEIWYTDSLVGIYERAEDLSDVMSGVLVLNLPEEGSRIIWVRPEVLTTIRWGGNPAKPVARNSDGELSPRASFESWKQQVENHSTSWRTEHVNAAKVFRQHLLEAMIAESKRRRTDQLDVIHRILRHDIQNKAGIISAYADMLPDVGDRKMRQYARRIGKASHDTMALTRSAWALARVIRSGGKLERTSVEILTLIERLAASLGALHDDAAVTTDFSRVQPKDLSVEAGPLLESVFRNLVSNAIKHNDKERKEVHVEVEEHPSTVHTRIKDNGPGIPETRREAIFAEGETRLDESGMGIGLYLVRLITKQYGGSVWIEDNEPEGTVFTVELPKSGAD